MGINPRRGAATNDSYIWRFSVIDEHMRVALILHGNLFQGSLFFLYHKQDNLLT